MFLTFEEFITELKHSSMRPYKLPDALKSSQLSVTASAVVLSSDEIPDVIEIPLSDIYENSENYNAALLEIEKAYRKRRNTLIKENPPREITEGERLSLFLICRPKQEIKLLWKNYPYKTFKDELAFNVAFAHGWKSGAPAAWDIVTKAQMEKWSFDEKKLFQAASENHLKRLSPIVRGISSLKTSKISSDNPTVNRFVSYANAIAAKEKAGIYIVGNAYGISGAAALFINGVPETIAKKLKVFKYYIIIPDECKAFIIPDDGKIKPLQILGIVHSVKKKMTENKADNFFFDKPLAFHFTNFYEKHAFTDKLQPLIAQDAGENHYA